MFIVRISERDRRKRQVLFLHLLNRPVVLFVFTLILPACLCSYLVLLEHGLLSHPVKQSKMPGWEATGNVTQQQIDRCNNHELKKTVKLSPGRPVNLVMIGFLFWFVLVGCGTSTCALIIECLTERLVNWGQFNSTLNCHTNLKRGWPLPVPMFSCVQFQISWVQVLNDLCVRKSTWCEKTNYVNWFWVEV